ncbi:pyridoxal phosphate-dependent aminotransferase [Clostridium senegalense]|uniref:pyridoxal phosphate-dependent aminotransferase n=1 Tax=Clostridium senegalense TaxID=1465809 RepID=UPI001C1131AE|nr:aminotransferase class I/II-fold pyridoxal phosphate-dependent enzyme [Clostridium senegalense]MBU5225780.1 aminotransferase class I/II-fold pyridoxal phosphate-dependent enzyme [Clostridium senegalense]
MDNIFCKNIEKVEISGIRKFYNKVLKVNDAISLTLGQPDFPMPESVKNGVLKAVEENKTTYTPNAGILELRQEISAYLKNNSIEYEEDEICITVGGSEGLMSTFMALINSGDKVLIPNIAYPAYESITKIVGGEIVNYNLNEDFTINISHLKEMINTHKPKILVLSCPSNPCGSILTLEERESLHNIIKENDIIVISDEIYASLCYGDYYSISQCYDIREKIIMVSGFSKMFSMTGLRIGYICTTKDIMKNILKVHQYNVSCATSISQYGALSGLKYGLKDVETMKLEFKKRRDYVYTRLKDMGFKVCRPEGAFYIFPSIRKFNMTSEEFCHRLLNEEKVAIVPGTAFGEGGEGYIRISYCYSNEELKAALKKLENFIKKI